MGARTITAVIDALASSARDTPAVQLPTSQQSYGELSQSSMLAARRLLAAGIGRGDRVGILLAQVGPDYLAIALGTARIGAISVPINARYKTRELTHVTHSAALSLLITSSWFLSQLAQVEMPADCRVVVLDEDDAAGYYAGAKQVSAELLAEREGGVEIDDPVRVIFTSGTTANPKGCVHTHRALLAQGAAVAERLELTSEDRFWTPLPMFHVAGWSTMLAAQARGACFSHAGLFEPGIAVEQITSQRCTVLFPGFETIWMAMLDHPRFAADELQAVRLVINVGVPQRMRLMQERLPHAPQVSNTGSTEACGFLAIGLPEDRLDARIHSAGHELAPMEVRIIDLDTGREAPDGQPGEMQFRGVWRVSEYYGEPQATAAAIDADGWFHTGDLVRRDGEGNLVYLSRIKDMLKVGGENVAAAEIEDFLLTHPAVHIVHVVGAPDERYGEVPAAFVELVPGAVAGEQELIGFCIDQIATFKVPRYVRTVEQWPMSGTKVKKVVLRELIAEELAQRGVKQAPRIESSAAKASR